MPQVQQKPIIHGRDHMAGGADPIPGIGTGGGGIQFDTQPQDGHWLYIETTGAASDADGWGMELKDTSGNWIKIDSPGGGVEITGDSIYEEATNSSIDLRAADGVRVNSDYFQVVSALTNISIGGPSGSLAFTGTDFLFSNSDLTFGYGGGFGTTLHLDFDGDMSSTINGGGISTTGHGPISVVSDTAAVPGDDTAEIQLRITPTGFSQMEYVLSATPLGSYGAFHSFSLQNLSPDGTSFLILEHGGNPIFAVRESSAGGISYHIKTGATWTADL